MALRLNYMVQSVIFTVWHDTDSRRCKSMYMKCRTLSDCPCKRFSRIVTLHLKRKEGGVCAYVGGIPQLGCTTKRNDALSSPADYILRHGSSCPSSITRPYLLLLHTLQENGQFPNIVTVIPQYKFSFV